MTEQSENAGVVVTFAQMYEEVRGTREDVQGLSKDIKAALSDIEDHETRIRVLEKKVWAAAGIAAFITGGGLTALQSLTGA